MARHDREESLEEQLAWLDAIKETEEAPIAVSAKTGPVASGEDSSPYPKDPWQSVPTEHETPTPPLFRAAVDSVYGSAAAEELPESEAEAGEWLDKASPPASLGKDEDAFMAPLKPLPRPDDTDSYLLGKLEPDSSAETLENVPWPKPPSSASSAPSAPSASSGPSALEEKASGWPSLEWRDPEPTHKPERDAAVTTEEPAEEEPDSGDTEPRLAESWSSESWSSEPLSWMSESSSGSTVPAEPGSGSTAPAESGSGSTAQAESAPALAEAPSVPAEREVVPEPVESWTASEARLDEPEPPAPRRRPAPVPVFSAPPRPPVTGRPTADSLAPESLLRGRRNAPSKGWRRLIYKASGGWIKPGEPPEVRRRRELVSRARIPVATGHHRVAVLSLKGGVGKTTTTVGLGATLAQMRGDRVIAVDANPDRGTLSDKLELETSATVRDLLNEREQVKRYVDIRAFTSQAPSRLEVLASDRDPSVSEAFSGADYQAVSQVLENFYSICITDCGTGLLHSAMGGVLGLADQIVLVSSPSVDGARAASATLDWLEAHHYGDLVRDATVVLCSVRPRSKSAVDIKKLEAHFAARCRAVIRVPYDPHLEEGAEIDLDRLQEATRDAYLQLAASIGDGFADPT
ncbi:MinD/ParA family ATP-binding protein [Nonomuraea sediminis]|uniref:MinD/ParA family ATP-binding protein n=1 Tax=Nonomuraea sediminis TaxID=2835864 RepID=UPI0027DFF046|nr:AAA family ATPase [Nonomuraea sediminis]